MHDAQTARRHGDGEEREPGGPPEDRRVRTPQGTMAIVLIYAAATVLLWAYVYYHMLRYGGGLSGH
ncbi:MAG TPA: hypothetical protein VIK98_09525 [Limnochordales bacterium]